MSTFKIIIQNQTTTDGRTYNLLAAPPVVHGGANPPVCPVTWHQTFPPLQPGSQAEFVFTDELFAFAGTADDSNSAALQPSDTVAIRSWAPVRSKSRINNGSQLTVGTDLSIREYASAATKGTFQITADASHPTPNNRVVGLARTHDGAIGGPVPVAALELKPGVTYTLVPSLAVWVRGGESSVGDIQEAPVKGARDAALVEFSGAFNTAIVREKNDGTFQMEYSVNT